MTTILQNRNMPMATHQGKVQIYQCPICNTTVEILEKSYLGVLGSSHSGLYCCLPMEEVSSRSWGDCDDLHAPLIERLDDGIKISVNPRHPVKKHHRIVWIELISDDFLGRRILDMNGNPEAFFPGDYGDITARVFCNSDGLWVFHLSADDTYQHEALHCLDVK